MKKNALMNFKIFPESKLGGIISAFTPFKLPALFSYAEPQKNQKQSRHSLKTELCFGLSKPDGNIVTEKEWQEFTDQYITPAFIKGFTLVDVIGQWQMIETDEAIKENTKLLILIHDDNEKKHRSIENIRTRYMKLFQQESVLRITYPVWISF